MQDGCGVQVTWHDPGNPLSLNPRAMWTGQASWSTQ